MAALDLEDVGVVFPVYGAGARSLRGRLLRAGVGGLIGAGKDGPIEIEALSGVSLRLADGDRLGLVGANGAGKSTLLRVMAGVYRPVHGHMRVEGKVSAIFDAAAGLDLDVSGRDNILLGGIQLGHAPRDIRRRQDEIADFSGLGDYLDVPVRTYSTGMLTRLAFAISTAFAPEILLLDEGIGAVDAAFMEKALARLDDTAGRARILVLATHDQALLRRLCTRAALLEHGRLIASGPVDEILERYAAT